MSSQATPVVALVGATEPGNIGTVARAMKNFGFSDLRLIDPPELPKDGTAYGFAAGAREDVLPEARETTMARLTESHLTVGFTAITNETASKHIRYPYFTPNELTDELARVDSPVALVFGREASGLTNAELAQLDIVSAIPASPTYPVLNLGQAATIVLYELQSLALDRSQLPDRTVHRAEEAAIERLYDQIEAYLVAIGHPEEKRDKTM